MVHEYTLQRIREAVETLLQTHDLNGWRLDSGGWYYMPQDTADVYIHLVRDQSERASVVILPMPSESPESLQAQFITKMRAQGLIEE